MKTLAKNVLIQVVVGGALIAFGVAIGQGLVLVALAAVIVGVWAVGKAFIWIFARLQRRDSQAGSAPRHHQHFDDAV